MGFHKELITYRETHKNGVIGGQQFEELYLANVSFSYNHSLNQKVLNDISLHIRPQELCAIVGFSGSGKSTLLKIILGLLSPDVGTVKINSIKANDFSHDRMYEWFSVVTQNPMCLNSSVRKNVDVTEGFSDDDIWNALKVAELAVDIKSKLLAAPYRQRFWQYVLHSELSLRSLSGGLLSTICPVWECPDLLLPGNMLQTDTVSCQSSYPQ